MRKIVYATILFSVLSCISCNRKVQFSIDYDVLKSEYELFGDELIQEYHDELRAGNDYTVKIYQEKFNLSDIETRILGVWNRATSYYGGEPDFIIAKPKRKVRNDVISITFYANRVCVARFSWDTFVFGNWKVDADKRLIMNIRAVIETKDKSIVNFTQYENQGDIVLVQEVAFTDYYIFMEGFKYEGIPEELGRAYRIKEDVPRVKHTFYWPCENGFDPKFSSGKVLYNFEWNEDSVKNLCRYFLYYFINID